uniref:Uncharacterized protein n=1 Tax=Arundo donax TaxID=35708 RepID=A0A0A9AIN0_ARUDO
MSILNVRIWNQYLQTLLLGIF